MLRIWTLLSFLPRMRHLHKDARVGLMNAMDYLSFFLMTTIAKCYRNMLLTMTNRGVGLTMRWMTISS